MDTRRGRAAQRWRIGAKSGPPDRAGEDTTTVIPHSMRDPGHSRTSDTSLPRGKDEALLRHSVLPAKAGIQGPPEKGPLLCLGVKVGHGVARDWIPGQALEDEVGGVTK